ncbi:MAG TPA: LysR family transcriptional regulator [Polyangiaceae bacterium]|nr:LysR family transcriptional regulator [Polyangiaceae bacterium]
MPLASHRLEAFHAVARARSFSAAARELGVTQPALSQRVRLLEDELGRPLLTRGPGGVAPTEAGRRLLRYCEAQRALEGELVDDLSPAPGAGFGGSVRVAGYSSVVRSAVLPALAPLFREHPRLRAEVSVREMRELPAVLEGGGADFVLIDRAHEAPGLEHEIVGHEELVLVESSLYRARDGVYLDHDPDDQTTLRFLRRRRALPRRIERSFFDDVYGVLEGVAQGFGRAVVPRHLLAPGLPVRAVPGVRPARAPVVLHARGGGPLPRAHEAARAALARGVAAVLRAAGGGAAGGGAAGGA